MPRKPYLYNERVLTPDGQEMEVADHRSSQRRVWLREPSYDFSRNPGDYYPVKGLVRLPYTTTHIELMAEYLHVGEFRCDGLGIGRRVDPFADFNAWVCAVIMAEKFVQARHTDGLMAGLKAAERIVELTVEHQVNITILGENPHLRLPAAWENAWKFVRDQELGFALHRVEEAQKWDRDPAHEDVALLAKHKVSVPRP